MPIAGGFAKAGSSPPWLDVKYHGVVVRRLASPPRRRYGTGTLRKRHDDSRHPSSNTAIESFDPGTERAARNQSKDGRQMAEARQSRRLPDGAKGAALDGAVG